MGLLFSMNGRSFITHVTERCKKALLATRAMKSPHRLSLIAARGFFDLKVALIATYGTRVIWEDFTVKNLRQLNLA